MVARLSGVTGIDELEVKHLWGQWTRAHRDVLLKHKEIPISTVGLLRLAPEAEREIIVKGITYRIAIRIQAVIHGYRKFMLRVSREVEKVYTCEKQQRRPIFLTVSKCKRKMFRSSKVHKYGNQNRQNNQNNDTLRDVLTQGDQIHRCTPLPVDIRVAPQAVAPCACESHETHQPPSQSP